ncbi:hypothetical protein XELAEV_18009006mg [Xenopus laevis]|uniref:Uncharacterized protein n=1 Tax=Xenopus laevis TaxID=8355 RepID=A0A974DTA5_XENLA|nr:hypothetical protein XELAEV_18009006mg [Xenopus laevis]
MTRPTIRMQHMKPIQSVATLFPNCQASRFTIVLCHSVSSSDIYLACLATGFAKYNQVYSKFPLSVYHIHVRQLRATSENEARGH